MMIDFSFANEAMGKGRLGIVFDPLSGFYSSTVDWNRSQYPKPNLIGSQVRFIVMNDRLVGIDWTGNGLLIVESTDRAPNLNAAEAAALRWYSDNASSVERGLARPRDLGYLTNHLQIFQFEFPKGFFKSESYARGMPLRIDDVVWRDENDLSVVFTSTDTGRKAGVGVFRRGVRGAVLGLTQTWGRRGVTSVN